MTLRVYCLWLLVCLACHGQTIRKALAVREVSRTELLSLREGQSVTILPFGPENSDFAFTVEIYNDQKTLVGRDDDESDAPVFTWDVPRSGRYYFVVRNISGIGGEYEVRISEARARSPQPGPNQAVVRVFYATNRAEQTATAKGVAYSGEPRQGELALGTASVSIPRGHRMGELEGPSVLRLEFRENPENHILVLRVEAEGPANYYRKVGEAAARSPRKEAFVFVHGFATGFDDALRRTAQISYDLGFEGAPILYSWPSAGEITAYLKDGRNAELSAERLREFLTRLSATSEVNTIHLIAHSMGNRVVTGALDQIARDPQGLKSMRFREVALMAPDVDAAAFRTFAARIKALPSHITLYASSGDKALQASQKLSGYPRAGQGGADLVVVPGIDTVDASGVDTSLLGLWHSYYADNRTILSDLFYLIRGVKPDERAGLVRRKKDDGATYWEFRPAAR